MSDDAAVISATFSEWKMVKTRKTLQLIFEVPLEAQAEALRVLGVPMPDKETWVAIARLEQKPKAEAPKTKRLEDMPPAQQAGALIRDWEFRRWFDNSRFYNHDLAHMQGMDRADRGIKNFCGIRSKTELNSDPIAMARWEQIFREYREGAVRVLPQEFPE